MATFSVPKPQGGSGEVYFVRFIKVTKVDFGLRDNHTTLSARIPGGLATSSRVVTWQGGKLQGATQNRKKKRKTV